MLKIQINKVPTIIKNGKKKGRFRNLKKGISIMPIKEVKFSINKLSGLLNKAAIKKDKSKLTRPSNIVSII